MHEKYVILKRENAIAHIQINRPKEYNALSVECMEHLIEAFEKFNTDTSIKVIILSGSGRGFCAGHDLSEISNNSDRTFYKKVFATCSKLMMTITNCAKPVIAKVHGVATAAGCQLVSSCDLAVAEENARFGTPGVNIGLFCSTPMVALSRNISKKHTMEMLMLGELLSAQRAYDMGLINRIVTVELLDKVTNELAGKIASKSSLTLSIGKKAFYKQSEMTLNEAYEFCSETMVANMLTNDAKEGIEAFLEKRIPVWTNK
jgi:enoyl-CoA hydratase/carnithine racemase